MRIQEEQRYLSGVVDIIKAARNSEKSTCEVEIVNQQQRGFLEIHGRCKIYHKEIDIK